MKTAAMIPNHKIDYARHNHKKIWKYHRNICKEIIIDTTIKKTKQIGCHMGIVERKRKHLAIAFLL